MAPMYSLEENINDNGFCEAYIPTLGSPIQFFPEVHINAPLWALQVYRAYGWSAKGL